MAKTTRIDLDQLEKRACRALLGLRWFQAADLPKSHRNAAGYAWFLRSLTADLPSGVANGKAYMAARQAVDAWAAATALRERAVALYNDPRVRAIVNNDESTMQYYWNNPEKLMPILAKHSLDFPQSYRNDGPVAEVMAALGEFQTFHETHASSSGPEPTEAQPAQQTSQAGPRSVAASGAAGALATPPAPTPP